MVEQCACFCQRAVVHRGPRNEAMRLSRTSRRLSLILPAVCVSALAGCVFFQSPRTYPGGEPLVMTPIGPGSSPCCPQPCQPRPFQPPPSQPQPLQPPPNQPQPIAPVGSAPRTPPAADIAVHKTGPATAAIDGTVTYRIEVTNPGAAVVRDLLLVDEVPDNFAYLSSNPPAEMASKRLQWRFEQLAPGQREAVELTFRVVREGSTANCAEVTAAGGLKATDCVTTTVTAPAVPAAPAAPVIAVDVHGPDEEAVGNDAKFEIVVTNRGQTPASGLIVKVRFDPGLEHGGQKGLECKLAGLPPGRDVLLPVTFRVAQTGRLCHTVQVLGPGGVVLATKESCVTGLPAVGGQAIPPPVKPAESPPGSPLFPPSDRIPAVEHPKPPSATVASGLSVNVTGLHNAVTAGEQMTFYVRVKNGGLTPERAVVLTAMVPAAMTPVPLGTSGPPPVKWTEKDHVVTFTPVETLGPGETLTYLIRVRARQAGFFHFGVDLSSRDLAQPLHSEEVTEVLQPPRQGKP